MARAVRYVDPPEIGRPNEPISPMWRLVAGVETDRR